MSLINIIATISCDECGNKFRVRLDPADKINDQSLFDIVENEIRGGTLIDEYGNERLLDVTSVQDDKMLCVSCTMKFDKEDQS